MIPVREFTSAEGMREHYSAVQARLAPRRLGRPPKPAPLLAVPKEAAALVARFREVKPFPRERALQPYSVARRILADVAAEYSVTVSQILGQNRQKEVCEARREAIALVYQANPNWSFTRLGRFFNKDHTSILYALRKSGVRP